RAGYVGTRRTIQCTSSAAPIQPLVIQSVVLRARSVRGEITGRTSHRYPEPCERIRLWSWPGVGFVMPCDVKTEHCPCCAHTIAPPDWHTSGGMGLLIS